MVYVLSAPLNSDGTIDGGSYMSHINFKKGQLPLSLIVNCPFPSLTVAYVDFKK